MPSPARRRGAAGRYVETLGSPVSQKRHGVSAAARSPTRGPVLTAPAGTGSASSRMTGPERRSVPFSSSVMPSVRHSRAGPLAG